MFLQKYPTEADQVGRLLNVLLRKTNARFDGFCEALKDTDQLPIVQELLTTDGTSFFFRIL